jgi:hypothetical protein
MRLCMQVVSLHSWGGPLTATCAAAFDSSIRVFPLTRTGARPVQPKAEWRAHAGSISALHRSSFGIRLFSGGSDGKAHMWDMKGEGAEAAAQAELVLSMQGRFPLHMAVSSSGAA